MTERVGDISRVYLCNIVTHDYFYLTRQGFTETLMPEYIGNYGLMYALNRTINSTQRSLIMGTVPFYMEDLTKFDLYVTPAKPSLEDKIHWIDGRVIKWRSGTKIMITYNSINTISNSTAYSRDDPRAKLNFPLVGKKERTLPLSSYLFYAIGRKPEALVRLGKKMSPVRIITEPLKIKKYGNGHFQPSHPVNISDTSSTILEATLYHQFPPLFLDAKMIGAYYVCEDRYRSEHTIALPQPDIYRGIQFPNIDHTDQT
jgi:CRISPR type I-D-associated protein Csc1